MDSSEQPLQETASRIALYAAGDGPCSCGQVRGHTGWLVCVLPTEVVESADATTKPASELERFHLLASVVAYPNMSTAGVRERANDECQHDDFDPLPMISPQAIMPRLKALQVAGLVARWRDYDCDRWDPTVAGRAAWSAFEATLNG